MMTAECSECHKERQIKMTLRTGPICYGCFPEWQRNMKARREAAEHARFLAKVSHPAKGERQPLRSVPEGAASGAQEGEVGAPGGLAPASPAQEVFWSAEEFEEDRRGLLVALLGDEARAHGLSPKSMVREEEL